MATAGEVVVEEANSCGAEKPTVSSEKAISSSASLVSLIHVAELQRQTRKQGSSVSSLALDSLVKVQRNTEEGASAESLDLKVLSRELESTS